jgi:hypothetical protein
LVDRALALSKDDPQVLDTQARVLGAMQRWNEAVEVSRLALAISATKDRQCAHAFWLYKAGAVEDSLRLVEDLMSRESANENVRTLKPREGCGVISEGVRRYTARASQAPSIESCACLVIPHAFADSLRERWNVFR